VHQPQVPTGGKSAIVIADFLSSQADAECVLLAEVPTPRGAHASPHGADAAGGVVGAIAVTRDVNTAALLTSFDLSAHDGLMSPESYDALCGEAEAAVRAEHAVAAEHEHLRRVVRTLIVWQHVSLIAAEECHRCTAVARC
jgi:hypothetical protein